MKIRRIINTWARKLEIFRIAIRAHNQRTNLSEDEKEREFKWFYYETKKFKRGKQYQSSVVHHPKQLETSIMHPKTYMQYKSQIEELERQVGAKVKGAKERQNELYKRLATLKVFFMEQ